MSYYDEDDDDDTGKPNPLRKVVKDLEKKLAAEEKARLDAEERVTKVSKGLRQRTVADVLKDKGADPRLAKYVIRDLEGEDDVTPDAVEQWLTTDGELFGFKPQVSSDPASALGLPTGTVLPPDLVAAYERFTSGQGGSSASASVGDSLAAKLADPALTREELEALIYSS